MPRPSKKYSKKSTKKYFRKSKKKYTRKNNNNNKIKINANIFPKSLFVKLPWRSFEGNINTYTLTTGGTQTSDKIRRVYYGNTICPEQLNLSRATIPLSGSTYAVLPVTNETYHNGFVEYSNFYNEAIIAGSSISITVVNKGLTGGTTSYNVNNLGMTYCVVVVPIVMDYSITTLNQITDLDGKTQEELISHPSAKYKYISFRNGANNVKKIKIYRNTKTMLGIKDLKDNSDLPNLCIGNDGRTDGKRTGPSDALSNSWNSPVWYYYVRVFTNPGPGIASTNPDVEINAYIDLSVNMKSYYMFRDRKVIVQEKLS